MDDQFLRTGKSLLHLSPKKVECLTAVVDSKELVQWLQSTIKCKCFASATLINCYQQHYVQVLSTTHIVKWEVINNVEFLAILSI